LGYSIEFVDKESHRNSSYILEKLDGNGLVGEANAVKIPGRDGAVTYNLTRGQRSVSIECAVISTGDKNKWMKQTQAENRDFVARCFDPKYFGTLYYYAYEGDTGKKIYCRPTGSPADDPDFNNLFKFKLGFLSDDAFWEKVEALFAALGMVHNNYRFPHFMGGASAFAFVYGKAVIYNPTLYDIFPVVTVYNSEIPVNVVNVNTGKFLKFKIPTEENRRIVIDIKNITATLEENINGSWQYKENVIHYLTLDSRITDFVIVPGHNEFKIETAEGANPTLTITAHEPVMGV